MSCDCLPVLYSLLCICLSACPVQTESTAGGCGLLGWPTGLHGLLVPPGLCLRCTGESGKFPGNSLTRKRVLCANSNSLYY